MRSLRFSLSLSGSILAVLAALPVGTGAAAEGSYFTRIATLPVYATLPEGRDPATRTAAEILAATPDGATLVFTDSPGQALGLIDITDPATPRPAGRLDLGGEPTSVAVVGATALVAVNTSESYAHPSGHVAVVDLTRRAVVARCDVGGQPDSVAASANGAFLAVAVENERDEDLNDGALPQLPPGHLAILDLAADGTPKACDSARRVALTGLAKVAPEDPEPEFVAINTRNQAVVTLQENNTLVVVDLASGTVVRTFGAGVSGATAIPTAKARRVDGLGHLPDTPREPDAVAWLDDDRFVTANEGDYRGGSRGFSVFTAQGGILFDSGAALEHLAMRIGHYPAKRAHKKGAEPEGVTVATFGPDRLIFVGAERANMVAVFRDAGPDQPPAFVQVLPTGVGPEGLLAIPARDLLVVANEEDSAEDGVRASVMIYRRAAATADYPTLESDNDPATDAPIGWGALSGLVADPVEPGILYAVSDSAYDVARIFTLDISQTPARILEHADLHGGAASTYDLEGLALRRAGGFWVVSEGHDKKEMDNRLIAVAEDGTILDEILLPEGLRSQKTRFGFEGVAEFSRNGKTAVLVAIQREWQDDPKGLVKLALYTPEDRSWSFVHYPLDAPKSPAGGWVGLSEIVWLGDQRFAVVERDNQAGPMAALKQVAVIDLTGVTPATHGQPLPVVEKRVVLDLLPALQVGRGWTPDKIEGLAVTADGALIGVTDNDGIDDATGETRLLRLGPASRLE